MTRTRRIIRLRRAAPVVLIVSLAAFLRLHGLDADSLWGDEMVTVIPARMGLIDLVKTVVEWEQIPLLHHVILHFWFKLFGESDFSVRLPSALAGIAGVFMMYVLVRRVLGRRTALAASLLLAVSPMHIAYSQEARSYAITAMLCLLSTDLFVRLLRRPTQRLHVLYAVVTALTLYAHLYSIFTILAQNLFYLWQLWRQGRKLPLRPRAWIIDSLATAALFSPFVPVAAHWTSRVAINFWVKEITLDEIARTYWIFSGCVPVFIAMTALVVVAVARGWRTPRSNGIVLVLLIMLVPVVVPVVISVLTRPGFVARHGIMGMIGMCAIAGAGVMALRPSAMRVIVLAALAIVSPLGQAATIPREPWREAAAYLNANMRPGDLAVVHCRAGLRLYDHYVKRPDVRRYGLDIGTLPVSFPLEPPGRRIWLVIYAPFYPANSFLARAPVHIERRWHGYELLILELVEDESSTTFATSPASPPPFAASPRPTSSP